MHEIWLVLNIVYEIALSVWPLLAVVLVVWLGLRWAARARLGRRGVERQAVLVGALLALALFFTVPILTQSSLSNRGYWVDWANLVAVALGLGTASGIFVWPLLALLRKGTAARMA